MLPQAGGYVYIYIYIPAAGRVSVSWRSEIAEIDEIDEVAEVAETHLGASSRN